MPALENVRPGQPMQTGRLANSREITFHLSNCLADETTSEMSSSAWVVSALGIEGLCFCFPFLLSFFCSAFFFFFFARSMQ